MLLGQEISWGLLETDDYKHINPTSQDQQEILLNIHIYTLKLEYFTSPLKSIAAVKYTLILLPHILLKNS